jgi:hypothetical protein
MRLTRAQLARIKALENAQGQITPRAVVAEAKQSKSPLHALFDWNTKNAAEKWWLQRAREVIGAVTVQVTHNQTTINAPCYVFDTTMPGQGYRNVVALQSDPASARESLVYTLETAAGHIRRAYDLAGPLKMQREIDALLKAVVGVVRVVQKAA